MVGTFGGGGRPCHGSRPHPASSPRPMALVLSSSWRRVMAEGIGTPALPERSAIAASLHRGELLCCQRLCTRRYYPALLTWFQIHAAGSPRCSCHFNCKPA